LNFDALITYNKTRWTRKTYVSYWIVIGICLAVEGIDLLITPHPSMYYALRVLVLPSILQMAVLGMAQLIARRFSKAEDYLLLLVGTAIASIVTICEPTVPVVASSFVLPLFVSSYYFEKNKTIFTGIVNSVALIAIYALVPEFRAIGGIGLITLSAVNLGGVFVAIGIMKRGTEILQHLQETMESNQKLFLQKLVMEQDTKLDGLTETYNHQTFQYHLEALLPVCNRDDISLHLLLIDIDDFKHVNDTYGHHVGDLILKRVVGQIRHITTHDDVLARYGGEEFALVLLEKTHEEALRCANEIRERISRTQHSEMNHESVSVSIGLASYQSGTTKYDLFVTTDEALYQAKKGGKNRVVVSLQGVQEAF
jgi:diguanylate cyclase